MQILGHKIDIAKALIRCPLNIPTVVMAHQPSGAALILKKLPEIGRHVDLILSGTLFLFFHII